MELTVKNPRLSETESRIGWEVQMDAITYCA